MGKAILYLEDGTFFQGRSPFTFHETSGEIVFNTSMTGYQEVLTDPSYAGQIVVMTYPLIGNYGVNADDVESSKIHVAGFVVKEFAKTYSNFRATKSLLAYLEESRILAMEGVDTRALTRHLRIRGAMRGIISTQDFDVRILAEKMKKVPSMEGSDLVKDVSVQQKYVWEGSQGGSLKVAVIDCGVKYNILRILAGLDCQVHVFPAKATAQEIEAIKPDGLFISNGPGDPAVLDYVVNTVKYFIGRLPIFGICLGHQILGIALGGRTYKLKFGHRGANQPVNDSQEKKIAITSQNHGFCVDISSLPKEDVEITHMNLNDKTVEGLCHKKYPLFCVQYHPEASPGPHDATYLFKKFVVMMKEHHAPTK